MRASIRNILVGTSYAFTEEESSWAVTYAMSLARAAEAHLTMQAASVRITLSHGLVGEFGEGLVAAENRRLRSLADLAAANARSAASLAGVSCVTTSPHLDYADLVRAFVKLARVHDLAVLDAEPVTLSIDRGLIESALFDTGRPVILVPAGTDAFRIGRVAVAWDGSAMAARALNDALPFLKAAREVEILTVTGEKDLTGSVPGTEVAPHLQAHGVKPAIIDLAAGDGDAAEALRSHAKGSGIDMLVMGAYAHSWIRHLVLGGVTQSMLRSCPMPLFLSR